MFNLIRSDFYKLFRSRVFYICAILSIFFVLMILYRDNNSYNAALKNGAISVNYSTNYSENLYNTEKYIVMKPNMIEMLSRSFNSFFVLFILIAVSLYVSSDFSNGVIKNIASKISKREYIFFSKFIISIFITFVILLANFLTFLFGSLALWGPSELPQNFYPELLRMCGLEFLAFIAMTSVFTILSILAGKTGVAVAINICILTLSDIILALVSLIIDKVFKSDFSIRDYWIFNYPNELANYALETDVIARCSLVSIAYIAIITLLGVLLIKRKEIK